MASQPTGNTGGGGGKSSGSSVGGSSRGGGKGAKASSGKSRGGDSLLLNQANNLPAHHAKHAMNGTIETKGKYANWPDGKKAFE